MGEKRERGRPPKQDIPPRPDIEAFRTREPYRADSWGSFVEISGQQRDAIVKYIDALERRAHLPGSNLTIHQQRAADAEAKVRAEAKSVDGMTRVSAAKVAKALNDNGTFSGLDGRTLSNWWKIPDYVVRRDRRFAELIFPELNRRLEK